MNGQLPTIAFPARSLFLVGIAAILERKVATPQQGNQQPFDLWLPDKQADSLTQPTHALPQRGFISTHTANPLEAVLRTAWPAAAPPHSNHRTAKTVRAACAELHHRPMHGSMCRPAAIA